MAAPLPQRLAAEAVGTFGFFFIGFASVAAGAPGPIGFGFGLMLMIAAFGHVSGGHYNPAVTFGLAVGRRFPTSEVVQYWAAQLVGGIVASLAAIAIFDGIADGIGDAIVNAPGAGVGDFRALIVELVAVALFVMVISAVATDKAAPWNGVMAPVLIGLFIFTAATVMGPISGGSFNPARSLAPAITAFELSNVWIYIVGPLVGGAIGGAVYSVLRPPNAA